MGQRLGSWLVSPVHMLPASWLSSKVLNPKHWDCQCQCQESPRRCPVGFQNPACDLLWSPAGPPLSGHLAYPTVMDMVSGQLPRL